MTAEIVSVGTELLLGQIVDTNAQFLGQVFPEYGITHRFRQTVGDNLDRLSGCIQLALSRSDLVITIGGLGPTEDDLTRDGVATALGERLILDEGLAEALRQGFLDRGIPWTERQLRQAHVIPGSVPLKNPNGSANGLYIQKDGKHVILLPGPRNELIPMVDRCVRPILSGFNTGQSIVSRTLKVIGLGESIVEERLASLTSSTNPTLATYAKAGEVHLRLTASAADREAALTLLAPVETAVRNALGFHVFGADSETIEGSIVQLLEAKSLTLAVAESITGGGLGSRLTSIPGAGSVFRGGVIAYFTDVKGTLLGVTEAAQSDPVSAICAQQMAHGIQQLLKADLGVSITGNAGPDSDKGDKPVGLVFVGIAFRGQLTSHEFRFRGLREDIRHRAEQAALNLIRRELLS